MAEPETEALPPEEIPNVDIAVFKEAICVTNSEMKFALEQYMEHRKKQMGSTFEPPPVVKKTMDYIAKVAQDKNMEAVEQIRKFLGERGLKDYEAAILCNLKPEDKDEAFTLLPSLKEHFSDDDMDTLLSELATWRTYQ